MKTYIELELTFSRKEVILNNKKYDKHELHLLHGKKFDIHKDFDINLEKITVGCFNWNDYTKLLSLRMWVTPEEVNCFEKQIMSGKIVPINVRFTPDNVCEKSAKNITSEYVNQRVSSLI